jgi:hypothetical protein
MNDTPDNAPAGDDPEELICRCDLPEDICRRLSCGRAAPGFRTRREIEPRRFAPKRGTAKKKGGWSK